MKKITGILTAIVGGIFTLVLASAQAGIWTLLPLCVLLLGIAWIVEAKLEEK